MSKNKKRYIYAISILVVLALVAALVSCGGPSEEKKIDPKDKEISTKVEEKNKKDTKKDEKAKTDDSKEEKKEENKEAKEEDKVSDTVNEGLESVYETPKPYVTPGESAVSGSSSGGKNSGNDSSGNSSYGSSSGSSNSNYGYYSSSSDSSSGSSGSSGSGSGSSSSSGGSSNSGSSEPVHTHSWVPITTSKYVVDSAAWDETVETPVETTIPLWICKCGTEFESNKAWQSHSISYEDTDEEDAHMSWHSGSRTAITYETTTIHHDEVGHYEEVVTGYKCSSCGATK